MAFTYDLESSDPGIVTLSRVRKHIPDRDQAEAAFTDAEIRDFIQETIEKLGADCYGLVELAAATAIDAAAGDLAIAQKVMKTESIETDGASLSRELRLRAKQLRDKIAEEKAQAATNSDGTPSTVARGFNYRMRRTDAYSGRHCCG